MLNMDILSFLPSFLTQVLVSLAAHSLWHELTFYGCISGAEQLHKEHIHGKAFSLLNSLLSMKNGFSFFNIFLFRNQRHGEISFGIFKGKRNRSKTL